MLEFYRQDFVWQRTFGGGSHDRICGHILAAFSIMSVYPHDGGRMHELLELKQTINLPKTSFSMKANLPQNEPKWLARWTKENPKLVRRARTRRFLRCMTALRGLAQTPMNRALR